jgi:hypothetical protein
MNTMAAQKARDLDETVRQWVENLFGRQLDPDEEVTVVAFPPHPPATGRRREAASAGMDRFLDAAAKNLQRVSPEEFDAAVDEAMRHARRRTP